MSDAIGCGNATRGVHGGGLTPSKVNTIQFITIATLGNAQDFGDLTRTMQHGNAGSSPIRAVWMGGASPNDDTMDFVTIQTTGNASDFGNLTLARWSGNSACSNGHGGL